MASMAGPVAASQEHGSLLCEAEGSAYLDWADHADWDFGTGDFCVDFWVRFLALNANNPLVAHGGGGNDVTDYNGWNIKYNNSEPCLYWGQRLGGSDYSYKGFTWQAVVDTWYHILVSRDSGTLYAFVSGSSLGSVVRNQDINQGDYPLRVGVSQDLSQDFIGNIDELRISDVYRENSNFSPKSRPYSLDANTLFLCNFNGADESTTFTDLTGTHGNALVYGTAQVDTAIRKW